MEEVQHEKYAQGEFIAVRWADPPFFWLARVEQDMGAKYGKRRKEKEEINIQNLNNFYFLRLKVMWLDPKGKFYVEDMQDTINKATVLSHVTLGDKGDKYSLSAAEKKNIFSSSPLLSPLLFLFRMYPFLRIR